MLTDQPTAKDYLLLLVLSLIWGSSFILIKKALIGLTPMQMASMRISISCLAFLPLLLQYRDRIPRDKWKSFAVVGLTGSGIPAFCYAFAQTHISSSVAGLINSLTPIFTFVIGILFFRSAFQWVKTLGLLLGLVGAALLILRGDAVLTNLGYASFILVGTLCYGTSVNVVKAHFQDVKPIIVSAVSFFMIGPPAIAYLLFTGAPQAMISHPAALISLPAVFVLSLFGTVLATVLYFTLVQRTSPVFGSSVAYLMPLVAIGWGLLDGEAIYLMHFLAFGLILSGIYLIRK